MYELGSKKSTIRAISEYGHPTEYFGDIPREHYRKQARPWTEGKGPRQAICEYTSDQGSESLTKSCQFEWRQPAESHGSEVASH